MKRKHVKLKIMRAYLQPKKNNSIINLNFGTMVHVINAVKKKKMIVNHITLVQLFSKLSLTNYEQKNLK